MYQLKVALGFCLYLSHSLKYSSTDGGTMPDILSSPGIFRVQVNMIFSTYSLLVYLIYMFIIIWIHMLIKTPTSGWIKSHTTLQHN